jgi:hypothetical protein
MDRYDSTSGENAEAKGGPVAATCTWNPRLADLHAVQAQKERLRSHSTPFQEKGTSRGEARGQGVNRISV